MIRSLLRRLLPERKPEPPTYYECCVIAKASRSEAGYALHREGHR